MENHHFLAVYKKIIVGSAVLTQLHHLPPPASNVITWVNRVGVCSIGRYTYSVLETLSTVFHGLFLQSSTNAIAAS